MWLLVVLVIEFKFKFELKTVELDRSCVVCLSTATDRLVEASYVNFTASPKMAKNKGVRDIAQASFLNKHVQINTNESHCIFNLRHLHMFKKQSSSLKVVNTTMF